MGDARCPGRVHATASPVLAITVLTTPPDAPTGLALDPASNSGGSGTAIVTRITAPTVTGNAPVGSTIELSDGAVALGTAMAGTSGTWSFTVPGGMPLAEGRHTFTAIAHDLAGQVSAASAALEIEIDTASPSAPGEIALSAASQTGTLATVTTRSRPTVTGTAEPAAQVSVLVNGVLLGTAIADGAGAWTFTMPAALTDGAYALAAIATDAAANASTVSPTTVITVDTIAPVGFLALSPARALRGGESVTLTLTYSEPLAAAPSVTVADATAAVTLVVHGGPLVWSATYTSPAAFNGTASITVGAASDGAGNLAPTLTASVTIDNNAPVLVGPPVLAASSDGGAFATDGVTADATPTLQGSTEPGASVTIRVDGVAVATVTADGAGSWTVVVSLSEGLHTLVVQATDGAGNVSAASPALVITVDTRAPVAPAITTLHAADGSAIAVGTITNVTRPVIGGSGEPGATVTVSVDGALLGTTLADAAGAWSMSVPVSAAFTEGVRTLRASQADAAGNVSPSSPAVGITVDTTPPAPPTIDPVADGPRPVITGTAAPGATVTVLDGTLVRASVAVTVDGVWTYQPTTALSDAAHVLTAVAIDVAGNVSVPSGAVTIVVDTTAPAVPARPALVTSDETGVSSTDGYTTRTRPTLSGTAEPHAVVELLELGMVIGATTAGADGSWTLAVSTPLAEGGHRFAVRARDDAGNTSQPSATLDLVVDTLAPTFRAETGATLSTIELTFNEGVFAADGGALGPSAFVVVADVVILSVAHQPGSGTALLTLSNDIEPVIATVHAVAGAVTDRAGNASATTTVVVVDHSLPVVTFIEVSGSLLVIRYDKMLDLGSIAAPADFTVIVDGAAVPVSSVAADSLGRAVTLGLSTPVASTSTVSVSYQPGAQPLRDVALDLALPLIGRPATNLTPAPAAAGTTPGPAPVAAVLVPLPSAAGTFGPGVAVPAITARISWLAVPAGATARPTLFVLSEVDIVRDLGGANAMPVAASVVSLSNVMLVISGVDPSTGAAVSDPQLPLRLSFVVPAGGVLGVPADEITLAYWDGGRGIWIALHTTRGVLAARGTEIDVTLVAELWRVPDGYMHVRAFRTPRTTQTLRAGLQLVTFAGGTGSSIQSAVDSIGANLEALWRFDGATGRWQSYLAGAPAFAQSLTRFEHREAIFVRMREGSGATVWRTAGVLPSAAGAQTFVAAPGFSTLGYFGDGAISPRAITGGRPEITLFAWDADRQRRLSYREGRPAFANTLTAVTPLKGLIVGNEGSVSATLVVPEAQ